MMDQVQLQIGKKFNLFDELDTLKAANHPMHVFDSQSMTTRSESSYKVKNPWSQLIKKWQYAY